jgi:hypothetical protein
MHFHLCANVCGAWQVLSLLSALPAVLPLDTHILHGLPLTSSLACAREPNRPTTLCGRKRPRMTDGTAKQRESDANMVSFYTEEASGGRRYKSLQRLLAMSSPLVSRVSMNTHAGGRAGRLFCAHARMSAQGSVQARACTCGQVRTGEEHGEEH